MLHYRPSLPIRGVLVALALVGGGCAEAPSEPVAADDPRPYLGQEPPGTTPALFAPGIVSTDDAVELNGVVSPDGREFFFTRMTFEPSGEQVFRMHRSVQRADGTWSPPEAVPVYPDDAPSLAVDMAYSPDGGHLYFLGRHPHELAPDEPSHDIWVSDRTPEGGWSLARPVPPPVWSASSESYPSMAPDGSLQFSSNRDGGLGATDLWRAKPLGEGRFSEPVNMGSPVNTEYSEGDSCVAPDGSYIVVTSKRPGGHGNGDLWVSFRDPESGAWGEPRNLGEEINSEHTDYCPMVTPDGRYLFFSRRVSDPPDSGWDGVREGNVYWVDARVITALAR